MTGPWIPDWANLTNESAEADWLADRDRKASYIFELSESILRTADLLSDAGALFTPDVEILLRHSFSIDWYISLAGLSLKTLGNLKEGPVNYGLKKRVRGIRDKLAVGSNVDRSELKSLTNWLSDQINGVWPQDDRSVDRAVLMVSAILGGRAIGQGQNAGGNDAVVALKAAIIDHCQRLSISVEGRHNGIWAQHTVSQPALLCKELRLDSRLICEFFTAGDTPDVKFRELNSSYPIAVGEVKGRKDKSNIWESWMPQVVDHMNTWSNEYPYSLRLFFGTLITENMINGESARGTERRGFRSLHSIDQIHGVYNLSKISGGDVQSVKEFDDLIKGLLNTHDLQTG
jgi:hypothetical protein